MDPLSALHATLLVSWTDPIVIAGAMVALGLIVVVTIAARRSGSPEQQRTAQELQAQAQAQHAQSTERGAPDRTPAAPSDGAAKAQGEAQGQGNLARGRGRTLAELVASEDVEDASLLSRFVLDQKGETVGETMTVTEDEVILKADGAFLAVRLDAILEKNGTLLADGNIDWEAAKSAGESWREKNLDRMEYDEQGMPLTG